MSTTSNSGFSKPLPSQESVSRQNHHVWRYLDRRWISFVWCVQETAQISWPVHHRHLSLEIFENIIDFCHDDRETLISCALTCRSWLRRSRHHLFRFVDFRSSNELHRFVLSLPRLRPSDKESITELHIYHSSEDDRLLCQFTAPLARRLPNLHHLCITGTDRSSPAIDPRSGFFLLLPLFTSISKLSLTHIAFSTFKEVGHLICSLPGLSDLHCRGLSWRTGSSLDYSPPFGRDVQGPRLKTLTLDMTTHDLVPFLDWLLALRVEFQIEHVELTHISLSDGGLKSVGRALRPIAISVRQLLNNYIFEHDPVIETLPLTSKGVEANFDCCPSEDMIIRVTNNPSPLVSQVAYIRSINSYLWSLLFHPYDEGPGPTASVGAMLRRLYSLDDGPVFQRIQDFGLSHLKSLESISITLSPDFDQPCIGTNAGLFRLIQVYALLLHLSSRNLQEIDVKLCMLPRPITVQDRLWPASTTPYIRDLLSRLVHESQLAHARSQEVVLRSMDRFLAQDQFGRLQRFCLRLDSTYVPLQHGEASHVGGYFSHLRERAVIVRLDHRLVPDPPTPWQDHDETDEEDHRSVSSNAAFVQWAKDELEWKDEYQKGLWSEGTEAGHYSVEEQYKIDWEQVAQSFRDADESSCSEI